MAMVSTHHNRDLASPGVTTIDARGWAPRGRTVPRPH